LIFSHTVQEAVPSLLQNRDADGAALLLWSLAAGFLERVAHRSF